jgi:hypothetical protein
MVTAIAIQNVASSSIASEHRCWPHASNLQLWSPLRATPLSQPCVQRRDTD